MGFPKNVCHFVVFLVLGFLFQESAGKRYNDYVDYFEMEVVDPATDRLVNVEIVKPKMCSEVDGDSVSSRCCEGYSENPQNTSTCLPICEHECYGGVCVKPNTCQCRAGYVKTYSGHCVETCPKSCLNGQCQEDQTCKCDSGYVLDKSQKFCVPDCQPVCKSNRNCTSPGLCECAVGYELDENRMFCEPICKQPCFNGVCAAPDVCHCRRGFRLINKSCHASCWQNCNNGVCSSENVCHCHKGYLLNLRTLNCEKQCEGCEHGTCLSFTLCECDPGYEFRDSKCQPICRNGCTNGNCVAPHNCLCNEGYKKSLHTGECIKEMYINKVVTSEDQLNHIKGQAPGMLISAPEFLGYKDNRSKCLYKVSGSAAELIPLVVVLQTREYAIIETCCPGYRKESTKEDVCTPICVKCENAQCVAPQTCQCNEGFVMDLGKNCVPTCPTSCLNGVCDPLSRCVCNEGYIRHESEKFCKPICSGCSINSNCTAPGVCSCLPGFAVVEAGPCAPVCDPQCVNGLCVKPNKCACYDGFTRKNKFICEANCTRPCYGGYCFANNQCVCDLGWKYDEVSSECKPICDPPCANGHCRAPNECLCYRNYKNQNGRCVPHCPNGCQFGFCIGPNTCGCPRGYIVDRNGRCSPMFRYSEHLPATPSSQSLNRIRQNL